MSARHRKSDRIKALKALVIGGTRFIGAHVVRHLHDAGAEVSVFHRGQTSNLVLPGVDHILDPGARYPITKFPPTVLRDWDLVVHMVAMGETDARAAVEAFAGRTNRLALISSLDVYRAYGRWTRKELGPLDPVPLTEDAPLRSELFPYRGMEEQLGDYARDYEKILAEEVLRNSPLPGWTILRLPKVYGPEDNGDLGTIYGFAGAPHWRWTHGYVRNVAHAIVTAATHANGRNEIFNVGEEVTPTMSERLSILPPMPRPVPEPPPFDFRQSLVLESAKLRRLVGYMEVVDERAAMIECASRALV
nr:NAD-dependent epimerase/dehydratase family protein [Novosphingobium panipatense]